MSETLTVIADRRIMGEVRRDDRNRLAFAYEDGWRSWKGCYPLSLQMPLGVTEYGQADVEPWLWGLLPDNVDVLRQWGRRFHVSHRNAFGLLSAVGEDCPGAVQLVRPDRVDAILGDDGEQVVWLTEAEVADRIRALILNRAAWRLEHDTGQFSLAGAQAKTALLFDGQRWGVPSGPTPTTHILKPPIEGFEGYAENEHICLELARELGLPAALSKVLSFEGEKVFVAERYDRANIGGAIRRLHQEDLCQALGLLPERKYQNEGGPGCEELCEVLWTHSRDPAADVRIFARAVMLNWLIGGTDAHAKNYSMLIGPQGSSRLAPLYDVASILPYDRYHLKRLKLSTKIGGKYRIQDVRARHWARFAEEVNLPPAEVTDMGVRMAERLPDATNKVVDEARASGLDHPILTRMVERFGAHARYCTHVLEGRPIRARVS